MGAGAVTGRPQITCQLEDSVLRAGSIARGKVFLNFELGNLQILAIKCRFSGTLISRVKFQVKSLYAQNSFRGDGYYNSKDAHDTVAEESKTIYENTFTVASFTKKEPAQGFTPYDFNFQLPDFVPSSTSFSCGDGAELVQSYALNFWLDMTEIEYGAVRTTSQVAVLGCMNSGGGAMQALYIAPVIIDDVAIAASAKSDYFFLGGEPLPISMAIQNASYSGLISTLEIEVIQELEIAALALNEVAKGRKKAQKKTRLYLATLDLSSLGVPISQLQPVMTTANPLSQMSALQGDHDCGIEANCDGPTDPLTIVKDMLLSHSTVRRVVSTSLVVPSDSLPSFASELGSVRYTLHIRPSLSNSMTRESRVSEGVKAPIYVYDESLAVLQPMPHLSTPIVVEYSREGSRYQQQQQQLGQQGTNRELNYMPQLLHKQSLMSSQQQQDVHRSERMQGSCDHGGNSGRSDSGFVVYADISMGAEPYSMPSVNSNVVTDGYEYRYGDADVAQQCGSALVVGSSSHIRQGPQRVPTNDAGIAIAHPIWEASGGAAVNGNYNDDDDGGDDDREGKEMEKGTFAAPPGGYDER